MSIRRLTILALGLACGACSGAPQGGSGWTPLFNGRDFSGWETYLGSPDKGKPAYGLGNDPEKVFSVVETDGAPAIRCSGQHLGGVSTTEEFENFHFRAEFKWGPLTWPPRKDIARDSGILYWAIGPHGAASGAWLKSVESNIMEQDNGSFWSVAGTIVDIEVGDRRRAFPEDPKTTYPVYQKGGKLTTFGPGGGGVLPDPIVEKPFGQWNTAEVIAIGSTALHVFNGQVTLVVANARHKVDGQVVPLKRGRIQLQSEFAEVYYRNIEVRSIREFPEKYRSWLPAAKK